MEGEQHEKLPPGFRFHPSDEELIAYYLVNKISDSTFTGRAIGDVDLNKCEPWDLPGKAKMGEKEWYFFCLRDRKYPTGVRTNRATNTGYWKTTGKDKEIFNSATSELIGMKKTLVFYRGRAPRGEKTNWVMHEYRIHSKSAYRSAKDEWVVCRVFQKSGIKKYPTTQSSRSVNIGMNSNVGGPPLIPIDPLQFPNMGPRHYPMDNLRTTLPFGPPHLSYPPGGCFTMSGLNLNLGSAGAVGTSVAAQQPMFRGPQQDINSAMIGVASTLAMENGFGVVDASATTGVVNRYANNMENCMEFDGYWPHYN